jgi:BirA family transcriptional regulator, biotin operon repressor / biotin---[acetyl-CoA-carboxylase] ligase
MLKKEIIRFDSVESTNESARQQIQEKRLKEGTVILADEQTRGKGHGSNTWESEKGRNLTFSLILQPTFVEIAGQFIISKAISLGIKDFLALYTQDVAVKWPNDIYVGDKKIAGILIENSIINNRIEYCIAGIGLNINQKEFLSGAPNPVSLIQITGFEVNLDEALELLLGFIETRYEQLKKGEHQVIDKEYLANLYRINEPHEFITKGRKFRGMITGIDKIGRLLIETGHEDVLMFDFNEVSYTGKSIPAEN